MIKCEKFDYYLSAYFDGELSKELCLEIIEHIEICPSCRNTHYAYSRLLTFCHHCCEIKVPENAHQELWQTLTNILQESKIKPKRKSRR